MRYAGSGWIVHLHAACRRGEIRQRLALPRLLRDHAQRRFLTGIARQNVGASQIAGSGHFLAERAAVAHHLVEARLLSIEQRALASLEAISDDRSNGAPAAGRIAADGGGCDPAQASAATEGIACGAPQPPVA